MDFDEWHLDARECISDRNARVRVGSSVDDNGDRAIDASSMDSIDDSTFMIGLESLEIEPELVALLSCFGFDIVQGFASVSVTPSFSSSVGVLGI